MHWGGRKTNRIRPGGYDEPSFIAETSFVRAPLNSRVASGVGVPKDRSKGKGKARDTLDGVPVEIQEALILEDLLFVLMVGENVAATNKSIQISKSNRGSKERTSLIILIIHLRTTILYRVFALSCHHLLVGCLHDLRIQSLLHCNIRSIVARFGGTHFAPGHVLHCYHFVHRAPKPPRLRPCESRAMCGNARHAEGLVTLL